MKTPDEIKKGLEYLSIKDIVKKLDMWKEGIAYDYAEDAASDALAYIQQLEAELEVVKRERDAAMHDIARSCHTCNKKRCIGCSLKIKNWVWRGLCAENGGEEE